MRVNFPTSAPVQFWVSISLACEEQDTTLAILLLMKEQVNFQVARDYLAATEYAAYPKRLANFQLRMPRKRIHHRRCVNGAHHASGTATITINS